MNCYGVATTPDPTHKWLCDPCVVRDTRLRDPPPTCALCPQPGGAFKATTCRPPRWAHVCCALWVPDVGFKNPARLSGVCLRQVSKARQGLVCYICRRRDLPVNAPIQCAGGRGKCTRAFHPLCARSIGRVMREVVSLVDGFGVRLRSPGQSELPPTPLLLGLRGAPTAPSSSGSLTPKKEESKDERDGRSRGGRPGCLTTHNGTNGTKTNATAIVAATATPKSPLAGKGPRTMPRHLAIKAPPKRTKGTPKSPPGFLDVAFHGTSCGKGTFLQCFCAMHGKSGLGVPRGWRVRMLNVSGGGKAEGLGNDQGPKPGKKGEREVEGTELDESGERGKVELETVTRMEKQQQIQQPIIHIDAITNAATAPATTTTVTTSFPPTNTAVPMDHVTTDVGRGVMCEVVDLGQGHHGDRDRDRADTEVPITPSRGRAKCRLFIWSESAAQPTDLEGGSGATTNHNHNDDTNTNTNTGYTLDKNGVVAVSRLDIHPWMPPTRTTSAAPVTLPYDILTEATHPDHAVSGNHNDQHLNNSDYHNERRGGPSHRGDDESLDVGPLDLECGRTRLFDKRYLRGARAPDASVIMQTKRQYMKATAYAVTGRRSRPLPVQANGKRFSMLDESSLLLRGSGMDARVWRALMGVNAPAPEEGVEGGGGGEKTATDVDMDLSYADVGVDVAPLRGSPGIIISSSSSCPSSSHWAVPPPRPLSTFFRVSRGVEICSCAAKYTLMHTTLRHRVVAGKSAIHGLGAFARVPHAAGDMVVEYVGELLRQPVADIREGRVYNDLVGAGTYVFGLGANCVDATARGNLAHLLNHSCDPNCFSRTLTLPVAGREDGRDMDRIHHSQEKTRDHVVIFAKRAVAPGEELTYDYRFCGDDVLKCNCGAATCRGHVNNPPMRAVMDFTVSGSDLSVLRDAEDDRLERMERLARSRDRGDSV